MDLEEDQQERTIVFISHALPDDNEFVLWLSAKLKNEGYDVWCELERIHGGEHFWKEIQEVLENKAIKFVMVASRISVKKEGVRTEWDFARELQRQLKLKDFIIPINLDGVNSNSIIGLTSLAMIQFQNSWAHGIKALISKLEKDNVPKVNTANPLSVKHWYYNRFATNNSVFAKQENFFSNWLEIPDLPNDLYLHEYSNEVQAKYIIKHVENLKSFPLARHERYLIGFEKDLPEIIEETNKGSLFTGILIKKINTIKLPIKDIYKRRYKSDSFPTTQDASNFLVQFMQRALHDFLISHGLSSYEMANGKLCYYYKRVEGIDYKTKYIYEEKTRKKQLTGIFDHESVWHYGVSLMMRLNPYPLISFKAHILFSDDGVNIWDKKENIASARRKKGKRMFNAEWRDLLLAFLGSLAEDLTTFGVRITEDDILWLSTAPVAFVSDKGYQDPKDEGRLIPIDEFVDEEDEFLDEDFYSFDSDEALAELEASYEERTDEEKPSETKETSL